MRPRLLGLTIGLMLLLCGGTASANAPSFDCRKAQTAVEWAICQNPDLAKADVAVAKAYQNTFRRLAPDTAALLAQDQKWFLAAREQRFDFYRGEGVDAVQEWLVKRAKFLKQVSPVEFGHLVGRWGNVTGELVIRQAEGGRLEVGLDTAETVSGRWVCSLTKAGTVVDGALEIKEDDGSLITFKRNGQALKVHVTPPPNAPEWVNDYCGQNGSIDGDYFPTGAPLAAVPAQSGKTELAVARLAVLAAKSSLTCLYDTHGGAECTADDFKVAFGDCNSNFSYGGIVAKDGVTLFNRLVGRDPQPVARLANRQLVCVDATAKKGNQEFYHVKAVPAASVAGCKSSALCKAYGDRSVQWTQPQSGDACRRNEATNAYVGDCASGWVDQSALEEFSMGL